MSAAVLTPGANTTLPAAQRIRVAVSWQPTQVPGMEVDASAFLLGAEGKVPDDAHFVFYGAPSSPDGDVRLDTDAGDLIGFEIKLATLPARVASIDICVTIHEGQARSQRFGDLERVFARVLDGDTEVARFELPTAGMQETAITLLSLYRRHEQWKVRALGQGFVDGLGPLARLYGVEISEEQRPPPAPPKPDTAPVPAPAPVNLSKVTLEKRGHSVSLEKQQDSGFGEILFNLNWNQHSGAKRGGFLSGLLGTDSSAIDLDLGCLWQLENGQTGVVQALGNAWGHYQGPPFIVHGGDDRTGAMAEGETIRINGDRLSQIRRILVFAFIYEGAPNWAAADGVATVRLPGQPDIEVRLDNPSAGQGMCAIALIENDAGRLKVTKEERYFRGHPEMDRAYGWGLRWVAGSKD